MKLYFLLFFSLLSGFIFALEQAEYGVASNPWPEKYGNHRAVVEVDAQNEVFNVTIPWRLKFSPASKGLVVVEASTSIEVKKIRRKSFNKFSGTVAFRANEKGLYYIYYLPYKPDPTWAGFKGAYSFRNPSTLFVPSFKQKRAKLVRIESRTELDSFYPMEVLPTKQEKQALFSKTKGVDYLLFVENRLNQVRMKKEIPLKWVLSGEVDTIVDKACQNEWYPIQVALYASNKPIKNVSCSYSDLKNDNGDIISKELFSCINIDGIDPWGNSFKKVINIEKEAVQPLWIGVDLPKKLSPGCYKGEITISADNAKSRQVFVELTVIDRVLDDRGDSDLWRLSRLRWLNSTAGLDENEMITPFKAIEYKKSSSSIEVSILKRDIVISKNGLPSSIKVDGKERLTSPFVLAPRFVNLSFGELKIRDDKKYSLSWSWKASSDFLELEGEGRVEADGYLEYDITIISKSTNVDGSAKLSFGVKSSLSDYIMGFNGNASMRGSSKRASWKGPRDSFWIGSVEAGLYCEMQGASYSGPLLKLYNPEYPDSWYNGGSGDYGYIQNGESVNVDISSGRRTLKSGEKQNYRFALIVTPVKNIDWKEHFSSRYYHMTPLKEFKLYDMNKGGHKSTVSADMLMKNSPMPLDEDIENFGINVINIHHAHDENPFINYPFATPDRIRSFIDEAHSKGVKAKIYYTVRELSNAAYEIWALRSLGNEIFSNGRGGGYIWLREHLEDDYISAWYSHNGDTLNPDAAIVTTGISRWYNYYVEGLRWMAKNYDLDGVYLDDVAFDRTILKRMRRVMGEVKEGTLIDLHSNTGFSKGPAIQYTEFFPYLDRLWFGESFDYDGMSPEQILVESSGIPFGLTGDMLFRGGNPWRGLLYGMTNRYPWYTDSKVSDPRPIFKLFDSILIESATFIPYWSSDNPVKASSDKVKSSLYLSKDKNKLLIAVASWSGVDANITLDIDWDALGLNRLDYSAKLCEIENMQHSANLDLPLAIKVSPKAGAVILLEKR